VPCQARLDDEKEVLKVAENATPKLLSVRLALGKPTRTLYSSMFARALWRKHLKRN